MKMPDYFFIALLFLCLIGCTDTDDVKESTESPIMFPNYLAINKPSEDPDMQWYVSDFFKKVEQWELETSIDINDLKFGMYELTQYPNQQATQDQKDAADKFVQESLDAAIRHGWFSKEKGLSDGYEKMFGDPVHFVNIEYVFDGETLNPDKPEVIMYYKTEEGDFLLGVMYIAVGQRGPQVGGPLSKWHYHIDRGMCYDRGILPIGRIKEGESCETGIPNIRSPEMLHVWFFDHSDGRYATTMGLTKEQLNLGIRQIADL